MFPGWPKEFKRVHPDLLPLQQDLRNTQAVLDQVWEEKNQLQKDLLDLKEVLHDVIHRIERLEDRHGSPVSKRHPELCLSSSVAPSTSSSCAGATSGTSYSSLTRIRCASAVPDCTSQESLCVIDETSFSDL
jgi:hypothetical protein